MKKINVLLTLCLVFCLSCFLVSCGSDSNSATTDTKTEKVSKDGPEYTAAYICPMHCKGSGSAKAGKCPACKMDYVANSANKKAHDHSGHNHDGHDHSHDGHDHSGHNH